METIVTLRESDHRYFDQHGREYASISKVRGLISPKFDPDGRIAKASAAKRGITEAEMKAEWSGKAKASTDHGTRIHNAIELYQKEMRVLPENEDLKDLVKSVSESYKDYSRVYCEKVVFSEQYMVAGTADVKSQLTNSKDSIVDFSDHKTNLAKGIVFFDKYKKYFHPPLEHLHYCNYHDYSLQLSIYALLEQMSTGCKIGKLWINSFVSDILERLKRGDDPKDCWFKIPVPYMKLEAKAILDHYLTVPKVIELSASENVIIEKPVYHGAAF